MYACEWNPNSVDALRRNLAANGVAAERCVVVEGDNRRTAPVGVADRVLLGLLPDSECSWAAAVGALRAEYGGVLHVHGNVASGEEEAWARRLEGEVAALAAAEGRQWAVRVEHVERVKWYAPRVRHVVADVRCVPARLAGAWAAGVGAAVSPRPSAHGRGKVDGGSPSSGGRATAMIAAAAADYAAASLGRLGGAAAAAASATGVAVAGVAAAATTAAASATGAAVGGGSVRRMHRPTPADFQSGPASTREPAVLTGLDIGPAPWRWSPAYLASMPAVASAPVSVHVSSSPHLDFVRKNFQYKVMPFGELLAALVAESEGDVSKDTDKDTDADNTGDKKWHYLRSIGSNPRKEAAHALEQFPDLAEEISLPADILWGGAGATANANAAGGVKGGLKDDDRYFSAVLRCSSGGLRLWTHYDAMDNALVQLHGEKRVLQGLTLVHFLAYREHSCGIRWVVSLGFGRKNGSG